MVSPLLVLTALAIFGKKAPAAPKAAAPAVVVDPAPAVVDADDACLYHIPGGPGTCVCAITQCSQCIVPFKSDCLCDEKNCRKASPHPPPFPSPSPPHSPPPLPPASPAPPPPPELPEAEYPVRRPFSRKTPAELGVHVVTRTGTAAPLATRWTNSTVGVHPTSTWWFNLVNCDPPGDPISSLGLEVNCNTNLVPYIVWPNASGLHVALPYIQEQGFNSANMFDDTISVPLFIGTADSQPPTADGWREDGFDPLSIRLTWPSAKISTPLVRGSPFLTFEIAGTPIVIASEQTVASISTSAPGPASSARASNSSSGSGGSSKMTELCAASECDGQTVRGSRLLISLAQSDETWLLLADPPIALLASAGVGDSPNSVYGGRLALRTAEPYRGVLRLAIASNCTAGRSQQHCVSPGSAGDPSDLLRLLDGHADLYPVGGAVDFKTGERSAKLRYTWKMRSVAAAAKALASHGATAVGAAATASAGSLSSDSDSGPAVPMCMMAHHLSLLAGSASAQSGPAAVQRSGHGFRNAHGFAEIVVARRWELTLPLTPADWHAPRPPTAARTEALKAELLVEAAWQPNPNYLTGAGDPYNAGKLLSRIARTALIAESLGEHALAQALANNLTSLVERYAVTGAENEWVWDETWGGLIGCGCNFDDCQGKCVGHCNNAWPNCPSLADPGRDFGNGFYNDHHFHWGYHVYAAAVAAKFNKGWARAHRERLLLPARDIASPVADGSFPAARHKDWYMMISWASGIATAGGMPYRQGRNQESTSEAVSGYYGVALLGKALGETALEQMGQMLLAMEVHAAQTYYHVPTGSDVYPSAAMQANHMVGILWQNLAQYQTWFGPAAYLVHAIQIIPVLPVTETLLPRAFVVEEYPVLQKSCDAFAPCVRDGWKPFATMARAIIDADGAWDEALATPDGAFSRESPAGNGNSRLNTLYWIATRPEEEAETELPLLEASAAAGGAPQRLWSIRADAGGQATTAIAMLAGVVVGVALLTLGTHALVITKRRLRMLGRGEGPSEALLSTEHSRTESADPASPLALRILAL